MQSDKNERSCLLRVDAVIVPVNRPGFAFAHGADGRCVRFTGSRDALIRLCEQVRASTEDGREHVYVDASKWDEVSQLSNEQDCWVHRFVSAA